MKTLLRHTLTTLCVLGLVATVVMWAASSLLVSYWSGDSNTSVHLILGSIIFGHWLMTPPADPCWLVRGFFSLDMLYWFPHYSSNPLHLRIPLWIPTALFLAGSWPAVRVVRRRIAAFPRTAIAMACCSALVALTSGLLWFASHRHEGTLGTLRNIGFTLSRNRLSLHRTAQLLGEVPLYMPTLIFAVIAVVLFVPGEQARRRRAAGLCAGCGYDLRASPVLCPECGMTP